MTAAVLLYGYMALMLAAALIHTLRRKDTTPPRPTTTPTEE